MANKLPKNHKSFFFFLSISEKKFAKFRNFATIFYFFLLVPKPPSCRHPSIGTWKQCFSLFFSGEFLYSHINKFKKSRANCPKWFFRNFVAKVAIFGGKIVRNRHI